MANEDASLLFTRRQPLFTQKRRFSSHLHQIPKKPCLWSRLYCKYRFAQRLVIRLHTVEGVQTFFDILFLLRKVSFYCFCEFVCGSFCVKSGEYDFSCVIVTDHICLASWTADHKNKDMPMDISIMLNCADIDKLIRSLQRCSLGRKKTSSAGICRFYCRRKGGIYSAAILAPGTESRL